MMENKILPNHQPGLPIPSMQQQSYMSIPAPSPPGIVQNATHRGLQQQNGGSDGGAPPPPPPPPPVAEKTQPKKLVIPAKKSTPKPKPGERFVLTQCEILIVSNCHGIVGSILESTSNLGREATF